MSDCTACLSVSVLRMGHHDPSLVVSKNVAQVCLATPAGPVSVGTVQNGQQLQVTCHGAGSLWIEPRLPALLGLEDHPESFQPTGKMRQLANRLHGLHLPRLPVVFHRLLQIILLQLVSWNDAFRCRSSSIGGCTAVGATRLARRGRPKRSDRSHILRHSCESRNPFHLAARQEPPVLA